MRHAARLFPVALALVVLAACSPRTREAMKEDAEEASKKANQQAHELKQDVARGAEKAAAATTDAADAAARGTTAASRTLAVKTALLADPTLDASHVDVDSDGATQVVHIKGTVPTEAQKILAAQIAGQKADGWTVSNELVVSAATTGATGP